MSLPLSGKRVLVVEDTLELAQLMAALLEKRGARVSVCFNKKQASAEIETDRPDAAIVDLLLPDALGSDLVGQLRALRVPAIAISGVFRGAKSADEALALGAVAFFEKPFRGEEVADALEEALTQKPGQPTHAAGEPDERHRPATLPAPPQDSDPQRVSPDEEEVTSVEVSVDFTPISTSVVTPIARISAEGEGDAETTPVGPRPEAPPEPPPEHPMIGQAAGSQAAAPIEERTPISLPFSAERTQTDGPPIAVAGNAGGTEEISTTGPLNLTPAPPRAGDLGKSSVPRLLNAFFISQATGALILARENERKLIYVERGYPIFAASNSAGDRFGQYCVRRGLLKEEELETLVRDLKPPERTGDALIARGILSEATRDALVTEQVQDIIWSTFAWSEGTFRFELRDRPRRELIKLHIFPGDLILEGVRRSMTVERLRTELPMAATLGPNPEPPYEIYSLKISKDEAHLLIAADGTKSVQDLVALSDLPERETLAFLFGSRVLGILDETRRILAGSRRMGFM